MRSQWWVAKLISLYTTNTYYLRSTIQLVDRRDVKTGEEMLHACFEHMRIATNGGRIRPTSKCYYDIHMRSWLTVLLVTVFPQKFPGSPGPRIWNPQVRLLLIVVF